MFLRKEHFTCYRTASRQRLCSPKLSSEIAWRLSEVLTSPFSSPLFKRLRLHVGFKSCVRVSEFSVDPENSDSLAADECDWTPSRRRDRLFPGSRTQHESSASVPPARFTWMYSFCFCTFSMKTLISHLTSDVKHSLHLTNSRFYRSLSILDMEIFLAFSLSLINENRDSSDSTEDQWLESRLGLERLWLWLDWRNDEVNYWVHLVFSVKFCTVF